MPITERIESASELRAWYDTIPFHYEYTAGVAGEKFLRGLREGRILAGHCAVCGLTSIPLRMYCIECYSEVTEAVAIAPVGVVKAVTRSAGDDGGRAYVYVEFEGVKGGLVHNLIGSARVGSRVSAKFKPKVKRRGSISDLLGFERSG